MGYPWTVEELEILKELFPYALRKDILSAFPKRSWDTIRAKACNSKIRRLKYEKNGGMIWDNSEIEKLKKMYSIASRNEILKRLPDHSWAAITSKASGLGLKRLGYSTWQKPPLEILPYLSLTELQKLDIARMIDTDGSIGIGLNNPPHRNLGYIPYIIFSNSNKYIVNHFWNLIGYKNVSVSTTEKSNGRKKMHSVEIQSLSWVYAILKAVEEYFIVKMLRAGLIVEFIEIQNDKIKNASLIEDLKRYTSRQHKIYFLIKELIKKGDVIEDV